MEPKEKRAFEPTGLVPRSIVRTFERFKQQLLPGSEKAAIREYRISRYQVLVSARCLFILITIPIATNWFVSSWLLSPLIEHFWNTQQNEIFLNSYQEERAFAELEFFSDKLFFESLLSNDSLNDSSTFNTKNSPEHFLAVLAAPRLFGNPPGCSANQIIGVSAYVAQRCAAERILGFAERSVAQPLAQPLAQLEAQLLAELPLWGNWGARGNWCAKQHWGDGRFGERGSEALVQQYFFQGSEASFGCSFTLFPFLSIFPNFMLLSPNLPPPFLGGLVQGTNQFFLDSPNSPNFFHIPQLVLPCPPIRALFPEGNKPIRAPQLIPPIPLIPPEGELRLELRQQLRLELRTSCANSCALASSTACAPAALMVRKGGAALLLLPPKGDSFATSYAPVKRGDYFATSYAPVKKGDCFVPASLELGTATLLTTIASQSNGLSPSYCWRSCWRSSKQSCWRSSPSGGIRGIGGIGGRGGVTKGAQSGNFLVLRPGELQTPEGDSTPLSTSVLIDKNKIKFSITRESVNENLVFNPISVTQTQPAALFNEVHKRQGKIVSSNLAAQPMLGVQELGKQVKHKINVPLLPQFPSSGRFTNQRFPVTPFKGQRNIGNGKYSLVTCLSPKGKPTCSLYPEGVRDKEMGNIASQLREEEESLKIKERIQEKILELAVYYNQQTILSITNIAGDFISIFTLGCLFIWMKPEISILKSFLIEAIYSLSDTTKSFLLILLTDLLVGFHSPRGWETALELLLKHFGLPENQDFVFLFVATFPVLLDTVFKYWIFRHLNKISPSTVATYHSMIE